MTGGACVGNSIGPINSRTGSTGGLRCRGRVKTCAMLGPLGALDKALGLLCGEWEE